MGDLAVDYNLTVSLMAFDALLRMMYDITHTIGMRKVNHGITIMATKIDYRT